MNIKSNHALIICLLIFIIVTICIGVKDYHQDQQYDYNAHENYLATINNNKQTKQLSKKQAVKQFETSEPNLNLVEKNTKARVSKAIYLACTQLKNNQDVNKYKHIITLYMGNQAGNILINDTKPIIAEFSVRQSQKLLGVKIGFGKFNNSTKTLPMNVLVKYRSSRFQGGQKSQDTPVVYYDAFTYNINAKNSYNINLHLVHHVRSRNNSEA